MDPELQSDQPQGDAFDQFLAEPVPTASAQPATPAATPAPGTNPQDKGAVDAFAGGIADTVTFGFLDELQGVTDTLISREGRSTVFDSGQDFSATLASNIAKNRAEFKAEGETYGKSQVAGQVVGALVIPFGSGARGALQVAKVGAVQGAVYGVGSGEGAKGRAEGAVVGGALGGVAGAALGKAMDVGGKLIGKLRGTAAVERGSDPAATAAFDEAVQAAPVINGPDGSPIATRLEDGSTLKGFREDGAPVYEPAPVAATPEAVSPEAVPVQAADEMVPLEAPPLTPEEAPTSVGSIGRAELTALQEDVAKFRANPGRANDITAAATPEEAARVGEFRLGNLGEGPNTQALLRSLAAQLPPTMRRTDQELTLSAAEVGKALGEDPEGILAWAKQAAGTLGDVDNQMMVLRSVWAQAGKQVDELYLGNVNWDVAGDELVTQAASAIRNLTELSHQVQIAKSGLGRGLRVNQLPDTETYLAQFAKKAEDAAKDVAEEGAPPVPPREVPPLPGNRKEIKDWFELWSMAQGDPTAQAAFLAGRLAIPTPGKYLRTSFANMFTASILSAPRTIAMNVVGPSLVSLVRNGERMGGAAMMALNPLASASERAAARAVARETPIAYLRTLGDIQTAFNFAVKAGRVNHSILGGGSSATDALTSYGPITPNLINAGGADPSWMYSLGNVLNIFPKAFARLNNGLDEAAKRMSYLGEIRVRAQVEAAEQGLSPDEAARYVQDKLTNSFDAVGHATDEEMLRAAERTTFTSQVGEEGGHIRRFANGMQGLRRDIPEMRYIVPVFNVPANALGETLRRIPLANRMLKGHAADLAGDNGVVSQAEAHGRTLMGASFLMAGLMLNRQGLITGAGPQEPTDRRVWLQTHQPYSIRVGDTWVRYDKFDLLGGLLSIPATIADASVHRAADEGIGDMMASGAGALALWFKDRAALRTASDLLNLGGNPVQDAGSFAERFAGSVAAGMIPGSGILRSVGVDANDPYLRLKTDWTDYLKAALPGLSQQMEPVRNVLGEPIQRSADTFGEAVFPVTMQSVVTYAADPVMDELARVYEVTGYGAGADPKSLGYGHFNPKEVKLEDGRSLYDRAMQKRMTMELDGLTLRATLQQLFDSEEYNSGVDADPMQRQTSRGDVSRGYLVRRVFDSFNKAAKAEVANESPTADRYLTAAAAKERDDAYLRDVSVEDLVATPRLYQDRGINPDTYSEKVRGGSGSDPLAAALGL